MILSISTDRRITATETSRVACQEPQAEFVTGHQVIRTAVNYCVADEATTHMKS